MRWNDESFASMRKRLQHKAVGNIRPSHGNLNQRCPNYVLPPSGIESSGPSGKPSWNTDSICSPNIIRSKRLAAKNEEIVIPAAAFDSNIHRQSAKRCSMNNDGQYPPHTVGRGTYKTSVRVPLSYPFVPQKRQRYLCLSGPSQCNIQMNDPEIRSLANGRPPDIFRNIT